MNNNKLFIAIIVLVGVLAINSQAMTCDYKNNPLLEIGFDDIEWICKTNETFCLSYVLHGDRLLQINPTPKAVDEVGIVDKYEVKDGISRVLFKKANLRADTNFTFGVKCGDETFEALVIPEYKSLHFVEDQVLRTKTHIPSWIAVFVIAIIMIFILGMFVRYFRRR